MPPHIFFLSFAEPFFLLPLLPIYFHFTRQSWMNKTANNSNNKNTLIIFSGTSVRMIWLSIFNQRSFTHTHTHAHSKFCLELFHAQKKLIILEKCANKNFVSIFFSGSCYNCRMRSRLNWILPLDPQKWNRALFM